MLIENTSKMPDASRLALYHMLSRLVIDPRLPLFNKPMEPGSSDEIDLAWKALVESFQAVEIQVAPGELDPTTVDPALLLEALTQSGPALTDGYDAVFGLLSSSICPVYESEYCPQQDATYRSQNIADVAGFYSAFGLNPSGDVRGRHDHIAMELEFMAWLIVKEAAARHIGTEEGTLKAETCREAQQRFLTQHLTWWVPGFALLLNRHCEELAEKNGEQPALSFYSELARILAAFVSCERAVFGIPAPSRKLDAPSETIDESPCGSCSLDSGR